jgi:hypothetical protein
MTSPIGVLFPLTRHILAHLINIRFSRAAKGHLCKASTTGVHIPSKTPQFSKAYRAFVASMNITLTSGATVSALTSTPSKKLPTRSAAPSSKFSEHESPVFQMEATMSTPTILQSLREYRAGSFQRFCDPVARSVKSLDVFARWSSRTYDLVAEFRYLICFAARGFR